MMRLVGRSADDRQLRRRDCIFWLEPPIPCREGGGAGWGLQARRVSTVITAQQVSEKKEQKHCYLSLSLFVTKTSGMSYSQDLFRQRLRCASQIDQMMKKDGEQDPKFRAWVAAECTPWWDLSKEKKEELKQFYYDKVEASFWTQPDPDL